jgi:hypothetical protein
LPESFRKNEDPDVENVDLQYILDPVERRGSDIKMS